MNCLRRLYSTGRPLLPNSTIKSLLAAKSTEPITVHGWVRSVRKQKQIAFADINDGTTFKGLQATLDPALAEKYTETSHSI